MVPIVSCPFSKLRLIIFALSLFTLLEKGAMLCGSTRFFSKYPDINTNKKSVDSGTELVTKICPTSERKTIEATMPAESLSLLFEVYKRTIALEYRSIFLEVANILSKIFPFNAPENGTHSNLEICVRNSNG